MVNLKIADLAEPLSQYVAEELDNIQLEVVGNRIGIYANSHETCDGSYIAIYTGMLEIVADKILVCHGGGITSTHHANHTQAYSLENPDCFDKIFADVKAMVAQKIET
jgi:hypothetical protein